MPYISQNDRKKINDFDKLLESLNKDNYTSPDVMNYLFSKLIEQYILVNGLSYQSINDIIGALECCKSEFYRRLVGPYQKAQIHKHGDL